MPSTRSISKQASGSSGAGCGGALLVVFGLIFGAVGVGVVYGISGAPLLNVFRARSWQPAQCEITFSQVTASESSARSSNETSRVNIQYRYAWNDKTYIGMRYDFTAGADNFNDAGKAAIVAQHRPGQTVACFVDPNDPTRSVINRDMKWGYLIGAAFGAPFALVPILIFWSVTRARGRARLAQAAATVAASPVFAGGSTSTAKFQTTSLPSSSAMTTPSVGGGPVVLKPESSRIGRLIGVTLLCLFWNGLVGVFTYMEFHPGLGDASWFLTLFLIPFQLIGVFLVWAVVSSLFGLANPKPTLTLSGASVPVGGSLTLQWQMSGATGRLRNLRILLCGREEAHYRRGTDSYTDKHTFYETPLVEATDTGRIERGMVTLTIPRNTMHSFASDDNKIIWSLRVTGEIGLWPDVDEVFDLVVRPRGA